MEIKSSLGHKNVWIILVCLILLSSLIWVFRPVSWRYFTRNEAVPLNAGMVWANPDTLSLPDWLSQESPWFSEYERLTKWWISKLVGPVHKNKQLFLLQDTGANGVASCLIIELGENKKEWIASYETAVLKAKNKSRFRGFDIYQFGEGGEASYTLTYGNLLIIGNIPLVVEACLAQLEGQEAGWLSVSKLWEENEAAFYFNATGLQELGPYLGHTARSPWWSFLANQIKEIRLPSASLEIDKIAFLPQEDISDLSLSQEVMTDSLLKLIPNDINAWMATTQVDQSTMVQLIGYAKQDEEAGRIWLGSSKSLLPTDQNQLLAQRDYFSFVLKEWKLASPPDVLGDWPTSNTCWATEIGALRIVANQLSALERWVDVYVVGAMGNHRLQSENAPIEIGLKLGALPPLLPDWKGEEKLHLSVKRIAGDIWGFELHPAVPSSTAPTPTMDSRLAWQYELEEGRQVAPRAVKDKEGRAIGEVAVQDGKGYLHLLDDNGNLLWKKKLERQLLSEVWQIENEYTGRRQYVFSTEKNWGVVDEKGEWETGFPSLLPVQTQVGMTVVDFDRNGQSWYAFIPTRDTTVYAFKWTGEVLAEWNPRLFPASMKYPVQHFQLAFKDYLLFVDQKDQLHVLGRNGQERFPSLKMDTRFRSPLFYQADLNAVRMVILDEVGRGHVIDTLGQRFPLPLKEKQQAASFFAFGDFLGEQRFDYALSDGDMIWLKAYQKDGFKTAFRLKVPHRVDTLFNVPAVSNTAEKTILGAMDRDRQLFSLWKEGEVLRRDMPLAGETAVVSIRKGRYITGYRNYIYAYDL